MALAPLTRVHCEEADLEELDRYLTEPDRTLDCLKDWITHKPRKSGPTKPKHTDMQRLVHTHTSRIKRKNEHGKKAFSQITRSQVWILTMAHPSMAGSQWSWLGCNNKKKSRMGVTVHKIKVLCNFYLMHSWCSKYEIFSENVFLLSISDFWILHLPDFPSILLVR